MDIQLHNNKKTKNKPEKTGNETFFLLKKKKMDYDLDPYLRIKVFIGSDLDQVEPMPIYSCPNSGP